MGIAFGLLGVIGLMQAATEGPSANRAKIERDGKIAEIVMDHYPKASLKAGEEGVVAFQVKLDKEGKLNSCVVTESSGYPRLDNATCEMIVATARFKAVRENGRHTTSTHAGTMEWQLPPGFVRGRPPVGLDEKRQQTANADTELICKRALKAGSLYVKTKVCLSKDDWGRALDNAQREARRLQEPKRGHQGY